MNSASNAPQNKPPPQQQQFKIKQRKREAVTKYEPEHFRDALFALLPEDPEDIDSYCVVLESNEAKLNLKLYAEPFLEIFIVGGLLAPGGVVSIKGQNPFSIFSAEESVEVIKSRVAILVKLARRLKYIPRKSEETLSHLLTYINKFGENSRKLAIASALLTTSGIISMSVLEQTLKDHLVSDGTTLEFVTVYLQTYVQELGVDHLTLALRKANLDWRLSEFFPTKSRTNTDFTNHFNTSGLEGLVEYHKKQQKLALKGQVALRLTELFQENNASEVSIYLKEQVSEHKWQESEVCPILWDSMMNSVDWSSRVDQIEQNVIKLISLWGPTLDMFTSSAKSQLTLLLKVQAYYDVLSESAIFYWFEKGAAPQGKNVLLKQMEPFVNWLREQESDEEDE
ncbi:Basic leucine zipper and W2 domain-containing protein 2 [Globomyces sp. JEL0801]|nr:Basic leucine zipper and W2 domain-containing protein 2 [Globomyces sp. JEL0801]